MTTTSGDKLRIADEPRGGDVDRRRWSRRSRTRLQTISLQVAFVIVIAGVWELIVATRVVNPLFLASPSTIVVHLYDLLVHGELLGALGITLLETMIGFGASVILGVVSAVILLEVPILQRASAPFITGLNNLPRLALVPLFILWFGIGTLGRVVFVVSLVYFIVLINTYAGLQNTERDYLILGRVVGANRWQMFVKFRLPSALPTLFAGFQLGLTYAFTGAVIAEMISGGTGLGAELSTYAATYDTAGTFADILLMALVATALSAGMKVIEQATLRWRRHEYRGVAGG